VKDESFFYCSLLRQRIEGYEGKKALKKDKWRDCDGDLLEQRVGMYGSGAGKGAAK
jgi:hypothetical protein